MSNAPSPATDSSVIPLAVPVPVPVAAAAQPCAPCSGIGSRPPGSTVCPHRRSATTNDIPEPIRLRAAMFESMGIDAFHPAWPREITRSIRTILQNGRSVVAFVVDNPSCPGLLAACGVGVLTQRFPNALSRHGDDDPRARHVAGVPHD